MGTDVFGNIQRMDNALEQLLQKEQMCRERLEELNKQLETAKIEVQQPFAREEELRKKTGRLEEVNALLNLDGKESSTPDEDIDIKELKRQVMQNAEAALFAELHENASDEFEL